MTYTAKFDHQEVGTFAEFEEALRELEKRCEFTEIDYYQLHDFGITSVFHNGCWVETEIEEQTADADRKPAGRQAHGAIHSDWQA